MYQESVHLPIDLDNIVNDYKQTIFDNRRIASLIKEHHDIKVTNSIIEQYIDLAISKCFTIDPVVYSIREMNCFDNIIDGKINYILNDGSNIAIDIETQEQLNSILETNNNAIEFMKENSTNFLKIINAIIRE